MKACLLRWSAVSGLVVLGCGGDVKDDDAAADAASAGPAGSGGAGTSSSTGQGGSGAGSSATGASSTGGAVTGGAGGGMATGGAGGAVESCRVLTEEYEVAFQAATACSACMGIEPCMDGPKLFDPCGCEVVGNSIKPNEVAAAQMAYDAWTAAGCGPFECGVPCFVGESWGCMPTGSGCEGVCGPS